MRISEVFRIQGHLNQSNPWGYSWQTYEFTMGDISSQRLKSLCPPFRATSPRIIMSRANNKRTQMLSRECIGAKKRAQKRNCCPTTEHISIATMGRLSLPTTWLGTTKLRFLEFSFSVAQDHFSICLHSLYTQSSSWQCTIQLIKYLLLNDIHILDLTSSEYTQITYLD